MSTLIIGGSQLDASWFLLLSAILFGLGAVGVLVRRNPLVILISIELMLNAANLTLVAFARQIFTVVIGPGVVWLSFLATLALLLGKASGDFTYWTWIKSGSFEVPFGL